jgi:hypothetical protein
MTSLDRSPAPRVHHVEGVHLIDSSCSTSSAGLPGGGRPGKQRMQRVRPSSHTHMAQSDV